MQQVTNQQNTPQNPVDSTDLTDRPERNKALDVMRGIAIILVMLSHCYTLDYQHAMHYPLKQIRWISRWFVVGGWSGVDLFFVLSGFLVSGLLFNEYQKLNRINGGRFLVRRAFKIYPGFFFFLVMAWVVEKFWRVTDDTPLIADYLKDLFFLHNYLGGRWLNTWSLDVEEAFYLLLTAFFLIAIYIKKINLKMIFLIYIALLFWGILARAYVNKTEPMFNFDTQFSRSHFRLDALFLGTFLSYLFNYHHNNLFAILSKYRYIMAVAAIICLIPNFIFYREDNRWISTIWLSVNPIAYGTLMLLALQGTNVFFKSRLLVFIGQNSYAMYLWHGLINIVLVKLLFSELTIVGYFIYISAYIVTTVLVGTIVTRFVERPFLTVRDKYFGSNIKARPTSTRF